MEYDVARNLIVDTFQSPFEKDRFTYFTKNLLNQVDHSKAFHARGYVPEIFKNHIRTYERIGTYLDPEDNKTDILIVYLQKDTGLDRARTLQRNFIARYLKDRGEKDAGLVAFVSPNEDDWRFSFVKMEYKFETKPSGNVKVREDFTPAKRYSFLVGKNEDSHTAQSRLVPLLIDDDRTPTLNELEDTFSIEKVTKDFFEKYRDLYWRTKESLERIVEKDARIRHDFKTNGVSTVDFSKKLLGQIVFLYFLQKKGWFGVKRNHKWGTGSKQFLRELIEKKHGNYDNFFNDILEPLFYEALARDRLDIDHWNDQFKCKIPFLNGGLFDPIGNYNWYNTDILLPNELFSNRGKNNEGTGILDVFDRYNFTVKEDEPLEKEVAVDPEMLGKVFENLLEVTDRKSKGTYYTPREIVHYMCQESLSNYLVSELEGKATKKDIDDLIRYGETVVEHDRRVVTKGKETETYSFKLPESIREHAELIDKKLKDIRVCDPAIGSGAFPVGMMNEIVRTRNALSTYLADEDNRTMYKFKRHAIHDCLYGVDIDPGAVEIAKLRLWLSLMVDEDDIKEIKPLPNLDYKIMQGNSLLEEFEGIRLFDENLISSKPFDEAQINSIKEQQSKLSREMVDLHNASRLSKIKRFEIESELSTLAAQLKQIGKSNKDRSQEAIVYEAGTNEIAMKLKRLHEAFFDTYHKRKKDEIKKEIEQLEWELIETTLREQSQETAFEQLQKIKQANIKPFFLWKLNCSEVFQEKGGFDVVIANPPYIGIEDISWEYRRLYETIFKTATGRFDLYSLFIEKAMEIKRYSGAFAFIIPGKFLNNKQFIAARKIICQNHGVNVVKIDDKVFEEAQVNSVIVENYLPLKSSEPKYKAFKMTSNAFQIISETAVESIMKDKEVIFRLEINTNIDNLLSKIREDTFKFKEIGEVKDGIVAGGIKDILFLQNKINDDCKKLYFGRHITKYHLDESTVWVNYRPKEMMKEEISRKGAKRPGLWMRDQRIFEREKIIYRKVGREIIATFGEKGIYYEQTIHSACITDMRFKLKYVLGLFNSTLFKFYYHKTNSQGGNIFPQVRISSIEYLPIKLADSEYQDKIEKLVDQILYMKQKDPMYDSNDLENKINEMIYALYGLTPEDIAIVEGRSDVHSSPEQSLTQSKPIETVNKPAPTQKSIKKPRTNKKIPTDYRTWQALSGWAKTAPVNTFWLGFTSTISNKIKKGSRLSAKEQENMKKCWKQAVKAGFES